MRSSMCIAFFFLLLLTKSADLYAQNNHEVFTILSYNVENLFDTINHPVNRDDEFTPEGRKQWNTFKYINKLDSIAKVIRSVNKNELPEIIGLSEVENRTVIEDLIQKLTNDRIYTIIHQESPDKRGIDVALLYRKDEFKLLHKEFMHVSYDFEPETTTRDILYAVGIASETDTLHFFMNHWSSRRGGVAYSEPKRIHAAKLLRTKIDSIQDRNPVAKIILMGDFNDEPTNYSLSYVLKANNKQINARHFELYNLMHDLSNIHRKGTYSWKGKWDMIDNLIVSQSLLHNKNGYYCNFDSGKIFNPKWILYYQTKIDEYVPSKTYGGKNYYGGFSDHLPVYFQLVKEE